MDNLSWLRSRIQIRRFLLNSGLNLLNSGLNLSLNLSLSRAIALALALAITTGLSSGCGYTFQNSRNPLLVRDGVQKIYVSPVVNNTYKAGIENIVFNNLLRTLVAHGRVTLVHHLEEADALLEGSVGGASYGASASTSVSELNPSGLGAILSTSQFPVATEYTASLACSFILTWRVAKPGKKEIIWSSSFGRSKPFPAANQLDVPGTTSALINDSEFDRALSDLAKSMMDDVHESMLAIF